MASAIEEQTVQIEPEKLANQLDSGSPSSVPVPLLVLGGLALLLLAMGGAGLVYKRVQARKPGS